MHEMWQAKGPHNCHAPNKMGTNNTKEERDGNASQSLVTRVPKGNAKQSTLGSTHRPLNESKESVDTS